MAADNPQVMQIDPRLAALARYRVLDTPRESGFDDLATLASLICDTPIAVVNLVSSNRQWFKAEVGLGVDETPLETSFCGHALLEDDFLLVPDATQDKRFACNSLVTGEPGLRFYAGALLKSPDGYPIGTLCVLDFKPRSLNERQQQGLIQLARQTMAQLELRLTLIQREEANTELERLGRARAEELTQVQIERDTAWSLSQDLLAIADQTGTIVAVNAAWTKLLGWHEVDLVGHSFPEFTHPDDLEGTLAAFAGIFDAPLVVPYKYRLRHKDGTYRCFAWTGSFEGKRVYATGRDVTAEHEREAELEHTREQLRQAQKMEAVGQLTGGIAHDFNNLLTGVIGSLDMMQRRMAKGETDKIERYATTAMTAANRAAALTHRLLAFSRRQPLDPKPVSANRLVTGMEELLRRTIGESVQLEIVTAGGLWQTLCDPHQLESAILNLSINARDAMPVGGKLTIETCNAHLDNAYAAKQRDVSPGQYVCVCVTDTGTGMTKDIIEKAFEPFFTTKPIGQGTGLGLSMIYGFSRQSEGYARIYSETGKGTTIKLYLPRYYGRAEDADDSEEKLSEAHRAEAGEVVLVVEDETAVRELVVEVLQELGYHAIEAIDGPAGLKLLQSKIRLDLLVTDIGLPGLNGRQLADAARVHRPDLKVLFMTGYAENAAIANGFLEPGMEMITKPFAIDALVTRIRDMIEEN